MQPDRPDGKQRDTRTLAEQAATQDTKPVRPLDCSVAPSPADRTGGLLVLLGLLALLLGLIRTSPLLGGGSPAGSTSGWAAASLLPGLPSLNQLDAPARPEPAGLLPRSWSRPPALFAEQAADTVADELAAYPRLAAFQDRVHRAAGRVQYLQPVEFLIWVWFDRRPDLRDELLALYQRQPEAALRTLDEQGVWPSARAELLLQSPAQYDADDDLILINLGSTDERAAHQVLVHELWHATPELRRHIASNGDPLLTNGFWSERWDERAALWLPIEDSRGLVFQPWLLDEAMAYRLERASTRRQPETHDRVREAAAFLDRVEELIGPERLLTLYLRSDDDGFMAEVHARRPLLAEYFDRQAPADLRS
jgi:hypothetical protein